MGDNDSNKQFHYSVVVSRDETDRMAEHEYNHGECNFFATPFRSPSKPTVVLNEIVNISLLKTLSNFGVVAGCLKNSDGSDGKICGESVASSSYSCYEYFTESPYAARPNIVGSMRCIKEYQKCPKKTDANGNPIPHWFCALCYQYIIPKNMKQHTEGHLRENISCDDPKCNRTFRSREVMEYHYKMSHIMIKCKASTKPTSRTTS